MIFRKKKGRILLNNDLIIDNEVIANVNQTKFLGIIIDRYLSFEPHIRYIKGKVSRGIGILCKANKFLNENTCLTPCYSFIHPYFTYCISIWGNTCISYLDPLIKSQKRAIRTLSRAKKLDHTSPLFEKHKLLKLDRLYIFAVLVFLHKYINRKLPPHFLTSLSAMPPYMITT